MPTRIEGGGPESIARFAAAVAGRRGEGDTAVAAEAAAIAAAVRDGGERALLDYTERLDGVRLAPADMRVPPERIAAAPNRIDPRLRGALALAAERIENFHRGQMPADRWRRDSSGAGIGERWSPIRAAGLYVPGGTAAYPSSVLMNAVPARVAGVERLAMVTPPRGGGDVPPAVLAAAHMAGIDEIWRVGGAQAVAALAWGAGPIAPVDKIVGPGNAWVAAAKRFVFGTVGVDSIAGPSEVLIVADSTADPHWIAADLLAQAEHDAVAQSILVTDDAAFADAVEAAVEAFLETLPRAAIARASWRDRGVVFVAPTLDAAPALIDIAAPEHLQIATAEPRAIADAVGNAGAIFLGPLTPEAIGDYVGGTNHVLPTSGAARFSSGLSVYDFLKRTSLLECGAEALAALGPAAVTLAEAEGLSAHALSVSMRLGRPAPPR